MTEILRTRDCVVFYRGASYGVSITEATALNGWQGGQGFQWADSPQDEFLTELSTGRYGGFSIWGSDEPSDQLVSLVGSQTRYRYIVLCTGNWVFSTRTFETHTYASRQAGPLVPIVYTGSQPLYFSLRGYWTNEDEWTLSGDPRAPNTFSCGTVVQPPNTLNSNYLGIQTTL